MRQKRREMRKCECCAERCSNWKFGKKKITQNEELSEKYAVKMSSKVIKEMGESV